MSGYYTRTRADLVSQGTIKGTPAKYQTRAIRVPLHGYTLCYCAYPGGGAANTKPADQDWYV